MPIRRKFANRSTVFSASAQTRATIAPTVREAIVRRMWRRPVGLRSADNKLSRSSAISCSRRPRSLTSIMRFRSQALEASCSEC